MAVQLRDIAEVIKDGVVLVTPSQTNGPSENDANVLIEQMEGTGHHRFYLANAYPMGVIERGGIQWRIESFFREGNTEYRLYITNFSEQDVRVAFQVYRFH